MIRIFQVGIGLLFSCALSSTTLIAQESLADLESFRTGCVALEDGRYETAATAFEEAWSLLLESDSGEVALDFVGSRYLEALVRNGRSGAALRWSAKNRPTPSSFATLKWTAIAHQDEQRFSEAAQIYSDLSAELPEPDPTLRLNHAICLSLSGRPEAGFTLLSGFSPRSDLEALQFARIALDAGALDEAQATLETLRRSEALSREIDFAALALQCWISEKRNLPSAPIGEILGFIEEAESEETALEGLLLLEEITTTRTRLPIRPELDRLADSREAPTARPASLFRVLWFSDQEERLPALQAWVESLDDSPARAEGELRIARVQDQLLDEESSAISNLVPGGDLRISFDDARARFEEKQWQEAKRRFLSLATRLTGPSRAHSLHNAALSELGQEDFESFLSIFDELKSEFPDSDLIADLDYLAGLFLASKGNFEAVTYLQRFVRENPEHPAVIEAQLALAEISLNQVPARPQATREIFDRLKLMPLTLEQHERLDYTRVWLEKVERDSAALLSAAELFVSDWPGSRYLPEVLMLLAERNYRSNRFEAARAIFDRIPRQFPDSPFAETARFFAARTTVAGPEAIERWHEIAAGDGPFSLQARHELGLLHLSLDQFEPARIEFQLTAEATPESDELYFAALADIAFSHYAEALANRNDPESMRAAADGFKSLSELPGLPDIWRYAASVRHAKAREALGESDEALEIYRGLVELSDDSSLILNREVDPRTTAWIFRAGFTAIDILAEKKDWKGAIDMADALSQKDGPRSIEAARLAERLRLKHWIWN